MKRGLDKFGIYNWTRWSAVDGKESPHYEEWSNYRRSRMTYYERRRYHRKAIGSPGSWAILKSMYAMLKDAIKKKYHSILVLQDDLLFHKRFREKFLEIPSTVPKNWKLLYIGATQHSWTHAEFRPKYYFPMGTADGAFAVGIHHSLYKEMLDEIVKFEAPFDSGCLKTIQKRHGRQCLILSPNLVIADIRDSDLRKSRNLVAYGKQFRWDIKDYELT
jgi:GR25 family glycosyltransferase involved in LPS biosynthesis